jgi:hypothetical protein
MPQYLVTWRIDIEADTPVEAAIHAVTIQRRPDSTAVVFEVTDKATRARVRVDLEPADDCPTCDNRRWLIVQAQPALGVLGEIQRCDDCRILPGDDAARDLARAAGFTLGDGHGILAYPPGFNPSPDHQKVPPPPPEDRP